MTLLEPTPILINHTDLPGPVSPAKEIIQSLNLDQWKPAAKAGDSINHLKLEIRDAISQENDAIYQLRDRIFPQLRKPVSELPYSGLDYLGPHLLEQANRGLLFNGAVEAVQGMLTSFDTLPLSVAQVGVCLVSYSGEKGAFCHQIFRRDGNATGDNPMEEVLDLLEARHRRSQGDEQEQLTHLARRGLMAFAERAVLMEKGEAPWRLAHGTPVPLEMLTGYWASTEGLTAASLTLLEKLITHERFLFVSNQSNRLALLSLGNALKANEYLVIDTIRQDLMDQLRHANLPLRARIEDFIETFGDQVVYGLARASDIAPPFMFYAHRDHVPTAALIAIADSQLHAHRGFPMLIDIASSICKSLFHHKHFRQEIQHAFAERGEPFRYLPENLIEK